MALLTVPQSPSKLLQFGTSVIALAAAVALLYYGRNFFVTVMISAVFSFLLDPAVLLVMRLRIPRGIATPIVIGVAFASIYFLSLLAWTQIATLAEDLPTYSSRVIELVDKANHRLEDFQHDTIERIAPRSLREQGQQIQQKPLEAMKARRKRGTAPLQPVPLEPPVIQEVRIHAETRPALTTLYGYVSRYTEVIVMVSFIPFLVFFMLSWRDRLGESVLHIFGGARRSSVEGVWAGIAEASRAYVLGNFLLWIFLSGASSIVYFFLGLPYWALIGPASGFFSLLPYVGLPLSIVPPSVAALAVPNKFKIVLLVMLLTAVLHIFAMNFLYAKIIGGRVRLNPLAVTLALLFWGAVWGGIGLILAVPITAGLKAVCDNIESLQAYGELLGD